MVENLWNDEEAAGYEGDLGARVYTSRLLGRDRSLVLHGGGNTSVKIRETNRFGEAEEILYVKGSGWDLETIAAAGFSPVRLAPAARLATLPRLSDPEMVNELRTAMKNATDNAKQLIKDLTLEYNKLRQANITKELLEITSAAMAMRWSMWVFTSPAPNGRPLP